ncbi:MAG: hypothetical protein K6L80_02205 [Agarilytica sp.]
MYLSTVAMISSIGANAQMTMDAMDAQVSGYRTCGFTCANGCPAVVSALDDGLFVDAILDIDIDGPFTTKLVRCVKLLAFAIEDLKQQVSFENPAPLIWLGAESDEYEPLPLGTISDVLSELDAPIKQDAIYPVNLGRASGIYALQHAYDLMNQKGFDYVVLGSAESPFTNEWLASLDERGRLKADGVADGFAPGEGAGFVVLARTPELASACTSDPENSTPIYLNLPGVAQSPSHWGNETAHKGEALHQAMVAAFDHVDPQAKKCDAVVSSLNGELFGMKEHRVALARLTDEIGDAELFHPFEYVGDLGAFSGILLLAQSAHLINSAGFNNIMIYSSSDNPWRSAVVAQGVAVNNAQKGIGS